MALTYIERIYLLQGEDGSGGKVEPSDNTLSDSWLEKIIISVAVDYASVFLFTSKNPDPSTQADAYSYLSKVSNICNRAISLDRGAVDILKRIVVTAIGNKAGATLSAINGLTMEGIANYIKSGEPTGATYDLIESIFEVVAGVLKHERIAYGNV